MMQNTYVTAGAGVAVEYTHTCAYCGREQKQTWRVAAGDAIPQPNAPGWRRVLHLLVCDKHEAKVSIHIEEKGDRTLWMKDVAA